MPVKDSLQAKFSGRINVKDLPNPHYHSSSLNTSLMRPQLMLLQAQHQWSSPSLVPSKLKLDLQILVPQILLAYGQLIKGDLK